jgi:beta-glucosidase
MNFADATGGILAAVLAAGIAAAQSLPYQNPDLPPATRAADLVSRMTLAEKVSQMQTAAAAIPRLGIPDYDWWSESLHGVALAGLATVFPQAIGLAATWDVPFMGTVADVISTEARAKYFQAQRAGVHGRFHGLTFFSPNINIFRDPRWGRGQETYGEDPYLTGQMAAAFIGGMQGSDPRYLKTVATAKHYAVHSGPEPLRHTFDAEVSEQDLTGTYLAGFRASAQAGVFSVMCAYNAVDGAPACASADLLQTRLRDTFGFRGYVVSDCGAISDIVTGHTYAPTVAAASALAVRAGTDLSCGNEYASLADAVAQGLIAEADLDRALARLFEARFRLGLFDPPERVPYASIAESEIASAAHRQLALEAALRSIVLLKNARDTLPIGPGVRKIAVVGPAADWPDMQVANYSGTASHIVTPLEGIRQRFTNAQVSFAPGSTYTSLSPALVPPEALRTPNGTDNGLLAEYFASGDFAGTPAVSRTDRRLYFDWDAQDSAIAPVIPRNSFAVRWTGSLTAPYGGDYVIGVAHPVCADCSGGDTARVYLDGVLLVDENSPMAWLHATRGAHVQLSAGSTHQLRIEYRQDHGNKAVELVWIPPADALLAEARGTIANADLALLFIGINGDLENEESGLVMPGFLRGDRTDLTLPTPQQQLLNAALDTGVPVVVVLSSGSAIVADGAQQRATAVLETWYPGEQGGTAIAQTLAGDNNPAGRLPVTFYQSVDQLPAFTDYSMAGRTYRFFAGQPLYRFGYGLSYSSFRYSHVVVKGPASAGGPYQISARITNLSHRDGDEVAQVYLEADGALPVLAGFQRVAVPAGQTRIVRFQVNVAAASRAIHFHVGGGPPARL